MRNIVAAAVLAAALSGLGAASAAAASGVIHDRFSVEASSVDTSTCSFPIAQSSSANIDDALFFDANGELVRILETVNHVEINYSAHGKTLKAIGTGGIDLRFLPDGSVSAATFGINLMMTIPGYGAVLLDVGRAEYLFDPHVHVLFQAGPASYDIAAFCAALS